MKLAMVTQPGLASTSRRARLLMSGPTSIACGAATGALAICSRRAPSAVQTSKPSVSDDAQNHAVITSAAQASEVRHIRA